VESLTKTVFLFLTGGVLLGAGVGSWLGHRSGVEAGLAADADAREVLAAEVGSLNTQNQQQQVSLQTAEASILALTRNLDDAQRAQDSDQRELELYRRIESGGLKRGVHVDEVQLIGSTDDASLRVTLLQVGGRNDVAGELSLALIGADLPNAVENRLPLADAERGTSVPFNFRFMTQVSVAVPPELEIPESLNSETAGDIDWMAGLDLIEIDLIPNESQRKPTRITVPADRMIVGPGE